MEKVLLAMSGGIDSSVAAMLLKDKYLIEGMTFRSFDNISKACMEKETGCCSVDAIFEAKRLAENLGFPHHILDVRELFAQTVISNFVDEYLHARTPNPCVVCNRVIKWGAMLKEADQLGCNYIATGHYAQVICENGRYFLRKGADGRKDQTYFLWQLSQENLSRTIFPLGGLQKAQVREIALENGYEKLSQKRESQEICFVTNDDYRSFLREQVPDIDERIGAGKIWYRREKLLGKHKGFPFYTIGQRKGLEVAVGHPVYVTNIDAKHNRITLGEKEDLLCNEIKVSHVNLMKYAHLTDGSEFICKIRYNNSGVRCKVYNEQQEGVENMLRIEFAEPVSAVTPGQSAVFYEGDDVVGGGVIE